MNANDRFLVNAGYVRGLLAKLEIAFENYAREQKRHPHDWGYVGCAAQVKDDLADVLRLLTGDESAIG